MKKLLKRKFLWIMVAFLGVFIVYIFSSYINYNPNRIIGKHYTEIISDYGEFDSGNAEFVDDANKYKYSKYFSYTRNYFYDMGNAGTYKMWFILETVRDPYDNIEYPHLIIEFDDKGYAVSITKGYLVPPGG